MKVRELVEILQDVDGDKDICLQSLRYDMSGLYILNRYSLRGVDKTTDGVIVLKSGELLKVEYIEEE